MSGATPPPPAATPVFRGAAWMIGMRWALRLVGLVSTAALARLLTPADFGVIAMAGLVAGLLDTAAYAGIDLALIKSTSQSREHYDSAWTIGVLQGFVLAALLALAAPVAASYYGEPRVTIVIACLAVKSIIDGFGNIGVVAFRKELDFAKEFRFQLYVKLLNLAVLVGAAFLLRNYLAIVLGMVCGSIIGVAVSYAMHPYRPRFSTARIRELWSFSNWLLVSRVGTFLGRRADEFILARAAGALALGQYHVATEIATMPTTEFVMPVRRALFPSLSQVQDDPQRFEEAVLASFGGLAIVCFAMGIGLMAVADEAVPIILGPQWMAAVPLVRWLALYGAVSAVASVLEVPIWVRGRTHVSAVQAWLELVIVAPLIIFAVRAYGIEGAAVARFAVSMLMLPVMLVVASRICSVPLRRLLAALWRPVVSGALMALALAAPMPYPAMLVAALAVKVVLGGVVYVGALLVLWVIAGKPPGPERDLLQHARSRFA
jgi:lipopolysaccharide exporter